MAGGVGAVVTVDGVGAAAVALAKPPKSASKSEDGAVLLCGAVNAPKSSSSLVVTVAVAADAGVAAANEPKSSPVDTGAGAACVSAVNAPNELASLFDVEAGTASNAPNISSLLVDVAALVLLAVPNMSLVLPSDASAAANEPKSSLAATGAGVASTAGAASFIELSPKPSMGVTVSNDN